MSGNEEFIQEFLVECEENLDQLDQDLVALEENPRDQDRLASIFRTIHTIKGTSGFFGYAKLGAVTHAGENLLGRLRDGELVLNPELTNALLRLVDAIREILVEIQRSGGEGAVDYSSIIAALETLAAQKAIPAIDSGTSLEAPRAEQLAGQESETSAPTPPTTPTTVASAAEPDMGNVPSVAEEDIESASTVVHDPGADPTDALSDVDALESESSGVVSECGDGTVDDLPADDVPADPSAQLAQRREGVPTEGSRAHGPTSDTPHDAPDEPSHRQADDTKATPSTTATRTIRVDVGLLNELMNQVGELVLARNQIRPFADAIEDVVFNNALQQLDLITGDLQEGIMKTRMQPIGNLWTRLPRVVRDLSQTQGKQVQLEMFGRETELDRTLIEAIKDPLTHLVRNAVDHGIELPGPRQAAGKPAGGTVVLRAFHEGGMVNIEISDDGAGIDAERVREKALHLRLISPEQARRMSAHQLTQLIFLPGLSTARRVTDISGRGVGMDVVKTNIEQIGGSVTIDSRPGEGTTLRVKIPLTLAIIPALMVSAGGQRFAIPQVSLREIITLFEGDSSKAIETIGGAMVYRLRGELLPLIRLTDVLRMPVETEQTSEEFTHVVVLHAIGQRFGLVVDQIARTDEIVVKPLHKALTRIPVFSGATVLGNGRVALILDVVGLARTAGVDQREQAAPVDSPDDDNLDEDIASEFGDFLVCEAVAGRRVAVPLSDVTRLEEFSLEQLGARADQPVVPYREQLMYLLSLDGYTPSGKSSDSLVYVVVHGVVVHGAPMGNGAPMRDGEPMCDGEPSGEHERYVGFIVHRIFDVARAFHPIDTSQNRSGMRGRILLDGEVLDVVDIEALARAAGIVFQSGAVREVPA